MPESNVTVTATFTAVAPSDGGSGGAGGGSGGAGTTGQALTIEALTAGTITVTNPKDGMQYTLNGGEKTAVSGTIEVAAGDKVAFYGTANKYNGTRFGGTAEVKVYGNIMSLLSEDFANTTTLTQTSTFAYLFNGYTNLKDASGLLLLATELTNYCYNQMFRECTALTSAPELKATTLAEGCCSQMFFGCTSLTTAPELKATTLAKMCYLQMFNNCSNLNSIKCLATNISASQCTDGWLNGAGTSVTGDKTFTTPSTTNWGEGDSGIPSGWTRLNPDGSEWIAPAATVTTAPTATTGDITAGSNTALVTAGTASGGTMMYAVTTENTKPTSTEGFTATVPTAESRAAGTFYVWYYVKADSTHTDSEIAGSVTVTVNAAPAAGTTVTWDSTNVFVEANQFVDVSRSDSSATFEGITIAFNGENSSRFNPYVGTPEGHAAILLVYGDHGDSFIFTAPTGKLFSRIEIISSNSSYVFTAYGDWTKDNDNNKIVWSGTPSSSVTLGGNVFTKFGSLESIVFTLVDAN